MVDEKVKCIDCKNIRRLRKDEKKLYFQCIGFCEGEGGTKTIGDITAERICSRYVAGVNDLDEINAIACGNPVKCLNCKKMTKLPYELATPTHHQNWHCGQDGSTKQYEDCAAWRCCCHFQDK
jgi:hypothetical protein